MTYPPNFKALKIKDSEKGITCNGQVIGTVYNLGCDGAFSPKGMQTNCVFVAKSIHNLIAPFFQSKTQAIQYLIDVK